MPSRLSLLKGFYHDFLNNIAPYCNQEKLSEFCSHEIDWADAAFLLSTINESDFSILLPLWGLKDVVIDEQKVFEIGAIFLKRAKAIL